MKVQIATPEKIVFSGEADDVLLTAHRGQLNILNLHADLVSFLEEGPVVLRTKGEKDESFHISGGVLKVENNIVSLLCPVAKQIEAA